MSEETKKDEVKNNKKTGCDGTSRKKDENENMGEKCDWKGVFEDITYSSGPGDNIFIFG